MISKLVNRVVTKAQAIRAARVFAITFVPQVLAISGPVTRAALISLVVSAAEVTARTMWPTVNVKALESLVK